MYGLCLIGAGYFGADPALGFPPGTPKNPTFLSWHAILHLILSLIGFIGLIATCFIMASHFASVRRPGWAWYSVITAVIFSAAFVGLASGIAVAAGFFAIATVFGFVWMPLMFNQLKVEVGS